MTTDYTPLWNWVLEREAVRVRKERDQMPPPWTTDQILATYRFCNVRREDDRVTRWIHEHVRVPFAEHPHLWLMMCAARQINWPATIDELIQLWNGAWYDCDNFDPGVMASALMQRSTRGDKVFTGAYIITAPATKGASKTWFVAEVTLGELWSSRERFATYFRITSPENRSLQRVHAMLMKFDGWGPFLAYQAVVDMRFTALLDRAVDREAWAAAGPGTIRGLNRVHGRPVDFALSQERALSEIRRIYAIAERETGVAMDFSDVPNILCETDKYLRVKNGEGKPRALYVPGRGA